MGRVDQALAAAKRARQQALKDLSHPRLRAQAMAIEAQAYLFKGSRRASRKAGRLILKALRIEPDIPSDFLRARFSLKAGVSTIRRPSFCPPYRSESESAEAHFRLGRRLLRDGDNTSRGRAALLKALEFDPEGIWGDKARALLK